MVPHAEDCTVSAQYAADENPLAGCTNLYLLCCHRGPGEEVWLLFQVNLLCGNDHFVHFKVFVLKTFLRKTCCIAVIVQKKTLLQKEKMMQWQEGCGRRAFGWLDLMTSAETAQVWLHSSWLQLRPLEVILRLNTHTSKVVYTELKPRDLHKDARPFEVPVNLWQITNCSCIAMTSCFSYVCFPVRLPILCP